MIGDSAFAYCKKISDIKIPEKIEKIGVNILEETKFYENLPEGENYLNDGDIFLCYKTGEDDPGPEKISVKDGTRIVAGGAMYQISSLKTVEIPDSVKYIGPEVCNYCSALETVVFPKELEEIPALAFGDSPIKKFTIPQNLKKVGEGAFLRCENLEEITLPDTLKEISAYAFGGCKKIKTLTIPESVESIGGSAFEGCKNLKKLYIPSGVVKLGENEITNNTALFDSSDNIVLYVKKGSPAQDYAEELGLKYENY